MNISMAYIVMGLTINLWQLSHTGHIRKLRYATDFEDDSLSRKLVEKSIFITPLFRCPPDHVTNHDGKCLKIVRINLHNQYYEFLLPRLHKLNLNRDNFNHSKKNVQENTTGINTTTPTTTLKPLPSTKAPEGNNIRPMKNKPKKDRISEGPVKIQIPISWEK